MRLVYELVLAVTMLRIPMPSVEEVKQICSAFNADIAQYTWTDGLGALRPVTCAVCDAIPTAPNTMVDVLLPKFRDLCLASRLKRRIVQRDGSYSAEIMKDYILHGHNLDEFVLSPHAVIRNRGTTIAVCIPCLRYMEQNTKKRSKSYNWPPPAAIANGYLVGSTPPELGCLNVVEVALLAQARIYCHTWVFYGGAHKHIRGWHTCFEDRPSAHLGALSRLVDAGWQGKILVVLCGPFTTTQQALTRQRVAVDPGKVMVAFNWLKQNNRLYKDVSIPALDAIPSPIILESNLTTEESGNVSMEDRVEVTVIFPDPESPEPTRATFESQNEFRAFVMGTQTKHWSSALYARPTEERLMDYKADTLVMAFPALFPYGHAGLPDDPAVTRMSEQQGRKRHMSRSRVEVLRRYLRQRNPVFHTPMFVLIVSSILRKEIIFKTARIHSWVRHSDGVAMAARYGELTSQAMSKAIAEARQGRHLLSGASREAQFLRSIHATCGALPTSMESTTEARKIYFAYFIALGLACAFVTINPDDQRNFRIVVYSMARCPPASLGNVRVDTMRPEDIILEFNLRADIRTGYPGLCAIEYGRIMDLVIKHIFQWDIDQQRASGVGCFGELLGWCLATEEQGRKTLHGHYLLFCRKWPQILETTQRRRNNSRYDGGQSHEDMCKVVKSFYKATASCHLFHGFRSQHGMNGSRWMMGQKCSFAREGKAQRHLYEEVAKDDMRLMRHKQGCIGFHGLISHCSRCRAKIYLQDVVVAGLKQHLGCSRGTFQYPDRNRCHDTMVYEMLKDLAWPSASAYSRAVRLFVFNSLVNLHSPYHAKRCFKAGSECYANLPDAVTAGPVIQFQRTADTWTDLYGQREERFMFRLYPYRRLEDTFMNTYNPVVTLLLGCNNNVMLGMTGRSVFYCATYSTKSNRKEEEEGFEKMAITMGRVFQRQEMEDQTFQALTDFQQGFRRLLAAVYAQTSTQVIAAPMAHYLALQNSRFRYSHTNVFVPVHGLEALLDGRRVRMRFQKVAGCQITYHKAMDYLFRPLGMEGFNSYDFYGDLEVCQKDAVKEHEISECFEFIAPHPLRTTHVVVYRTHRAIPVFPWNWVPSTLSFSVALTNFDFSSHEVTEDMEQYAKRLMIILVPFRKLQDLGGPDGSRFCETFMSGNVQRNFSSRQREIANNIQNIHNSLSSQLPDNQLKMETEMERSLREEATEEASEDEEEMEFDVVLEEIFPALRQSESGLTEDPTTFIPQYAKRSFRFRGAEEGDNSMPIRYQDAFGFEGSLVGVARRETDLNEHVSQPRFETSASDLNILICERVMTRREMVESEEDARSPGNGQSRVVATGSWESIRGWAELSHLDREQQIAFEILSATYVLSFHDSAAGYPLLLETEGSLRLQRASLRRLARMTEVSDVPLRLFVTGPAGAGKSMLLDSFQDYAKHFSKNLGHVYTTATVRVTAMTGVAATEIGGDTAQHEFAMLLKRNFLNVDEVRSFDDTRMSIVDEISFMSYGEDGLGKLSLRLQQFTECTRYHFGRLPLAFLGDFRQLKPVKGHPIYMHPNAPLWEQTLTCMVELEGRHRFAGCEHMKRILPTIRDSGQLSARDLRTLNARVVDPDIGILPAIHDVQFACHFNKTRTEINGSVFKAYLRNVHGDASESHIPTSAIVIMAKTVWSRSKASLTFDQRKVLFENCGEADCVWGNRKRVDPFLTLFQNCKVMCTENADVRHGIANGTTARFRRVVLKPGVQLKALQVHGFWVWGIGSEDVQYVELQWDDCRFNGTFRLFARTNGCIVNFPVPEAGRGRKIGVKIDLTYFPVVLNHATTGHKLQGKSTDNLVVVEWNRKKNWAYVVLSRVRTLAGLILCKKIPSGMDFRPDQKYTEMMERLRATILAKPIPTEELQGNLHS